VGKFLKDIGVVMQQHEAERHAVTQAEAKEVIALFLGGLLRVKNEILDSHPYEADPKKRELWIRYTTIKKNPNLKHLLTDKEFANFYNSVQKTMNIFTAESDFSSQAVCEMVSTLDRLHKYLKHNDLSLLVGLWENRKLSYMIISQMASLLEDIRWFLLLNAKDPFIRAVLKLAIVAPQESKDEPAGGALGAVEKILIELVQQMYGKKVSNLKDAALYLATENSDYLLANILKLASPAVKEKIKQFLVNVVGIDKIKDKEV
jgi:hypothetical protein